MGGGGVLMCVIAWWVAWGWVGSVGVWVVGLCDYCVVGDVSLVV